MQIFLTNYVVTFSDPSFVLNAVSSPPAGLYYVNSSVTLQVSVILFTGVPAPEDLVPGVVSGPGGCLLQGVWSWGVPGRGV